MSWNDERIDRLSRLWLEGRSASQIAAELGQGVTRNAVIGKVHRLGLSGRARVPSSASAVRPRPKVPPRPPSEETGPAVPIPIAVAGLTVAAAAGVPSPSVVIPISDRVTIMELRETMCRWPIGDPTSSEFRYCGCRSEMGPYCKDHARLAFQPVQDRRRPDRVARIA